MEQFVRDGADPAFEREAGRKKNSSPKVRKRVKQPENKSRRNLGFFGTAEGGSSGSLTKTFRFFSASATPGKNEQASKKPNVGWRVEGGGGGAARGTGCGEKEERNNAHDSFLALWTKETASE